MQNRNMKLYILQCMHFDLCINLVKAAGPLLMGYKYDHSKVKLFAKNNIQEFEKVVAMVVKHNRQKLDGQDEDTHAWYKIISEALVASDADFDNWFVEKVKLFDYRLVQPREKYTSDHCLGFAYVALTNRNDSQFCDADMDLNFRAVKFQEHFAKTQCSESELKLGDLILYKNSQNQYTHAAIYLGKNKDELFAVSRPGSDLDVFVYPVHGTSSANGKPYYFRPDKISKETLTTLLYYKEEMFKLFKPSKTLESLHPFMIKHWQSELNYTAFFAAKKLTPVTPITDSRKCKVQR